MARGGKRPNAGRKKGSKGRLRKALTRLRTVEEIIGGGLSPLDYLVQILTDEDADPSLRVEAARAAAPYCHKRQPQAVEVTGNVAPVIQIITPLTHGATPANNPG